jgi:hypothetical protein
MERPQGRVTAGEMGDGATEVGFLRWKHSTDALSVNGADLREACSGL